MQCVLVSANTPPKEFFDNIPIRPGENVIGYLPNILSLVIPIQGKGMPRKDELQKQMVERPTDLVGTDQRIVCYKVEEVHEFPFPKKQVFRVRFVAPLEEISEIRVKDLRLEFMAKLTGLGLSLVYLMTVGSDETQSLAQWLEAICKQRVEAVGGLYDVSTGALHVGPRAGKTDEELEREME
jgi:hypothetical protein